MSSSRRSCKTYRRFRSACAWSTAGCSTPKVKLDQQVRASTSPPTTMKRAQELGRVTKQFTNVNVMDNVLSVTAYLTSRGIFAGRTSCAVTPKTIA